MTKSKPVAPKPVLAWCALYNGKIAAGWCCWDRETASRWADSNPGGKLIRVEIRPAPKQADQLAWVDRAMATANAMLTLTINGECMGSIHEERDKLHAILMEQVRPAPKRKGATKP